MLFSLMIRGERDEARRDENPSDNIGIKPIAPMDSHARRLIRITPSLRAMQFLLYAELRNTTSCEISLHLRFILLAQLNQSKLITGVSLT